MPSNGSVERDTEQEEKSANALGGNSVDEQSRGHDLADVMARE